MYIYQIKNIYSSLKKLKISRICNMIFNNNIMKFFLYIFLICFTFITISCSYEESINKDDIDVSNKNNLYIKQQKISWYQPKPLTTWQWQLSGDINTKYNVEVYDVDLEETPQQTIDFLHQQGKKVICYFNGGAYELYRSDAEKFSKESLGNTLEDWENERWLDIANYEKFADIMKARLDKAVEKKCDGVEPDNMDGFTNETGFSLTYDDQLQYNRWMSEEAHVRGLSIGLKNDLDQIKDLVNNFDFAVNEQCFEYEECKKLLPFIKQGKAIFHVEYELELKEFCKQVQSMKFSSLKMEYDLDGQRLSCKDDWESERETLREIKKSL
jgi:hypothetical protein